MLLKDNTDTVKTNRTVKIIKFLKNIQWCKLVFLANWLWCKIVRESVI